MTLLTPAPVSPGSPPSGRPRLPHLGALDGIRALAVIAVLLYHGEVSGMPGGFLGVEMFFVLSGYLVTAILWGEWRHRGGIDLRRFWVGRVRRLLPAAVVLIGVVAAALVIGWPEEAARTRGELVSSLGYVSNWYLVFTNQSYFAGFGRPSPVRHLWSLAVEAQFYLLWPLIFVGLARRIRDERWLATATLGLAGLSVLLAQVLYHPGQDPSRVYYGTDTRASGLLLGCALAFCWRPFEDPRPVSARQRTVIDVVTAVATLGLLVAIIRVTELAEKTYRGGILGVSLLTVALLATAVHPQARLARWLFAGRVAQAIGRRSYSLYLWHWPVFVLLRPRVDIGWSSGPTLVLRLVLTAALAELSYRYVEQPVRRGVLGTMGTRVRRALRDADPERRRQLLTAWGGLGAVFVVMVGSVVGLMAVADEPPPPFDATPRVVTVAAITLAPIPEVTTTVAPTTAAPPATAPVRSVPDTTATTVAGQVTTTVVPTTAAPVTTVPLPPATAVAPAGTVAYALGDSVMLSAGDALEAAIPGIAIDARVARQVDEGIETLRAWKAAGGTANAIIVHLGNNGTLFGDDVDTIMGIVGPNTRVVFLNVRVPRKWEEDVNWALGEVVPRYANARLVDWRALSDSCPPDSFNEDEVHLRAEGAPCYANLIAAALG